LSINNKLLRNDVNNFSVERKCNALCVFDQSINIFLRDFILRSADTDDTPALKALDVIARNADRNVVIFTPDCCSASCTAA